MATPLQGQWYTQQNTFLLSEAPVGVYLKGMPLQIPVGSGKALEYN